jgi:REP element-mobilizing transposase RayT
MSLSKTMQLIKGESSHWINKNSLTTHKFEWADEYYGVSISESHLNRVRAYIRNQEIHHKVKTWDEEADDFIRKYGFSRFPG